VAERIVLGVDPGGTGVHGWALLRHRPGKRALYLSAGHTDDAPLDLFARVGHVDVLAVEMPLVVHNPKAIRQVLATRGAAGIFTGIGQAYRIPVVELHPGKWRGTLCHNSSPTDAMVKKAVTLHVEWWPTRSNSHMRDAAGVALVAMLLPPTPSPGTAR
jgi:Holliday junction resolvasome RuvABC endonuclease subunit